MATEDMGEPKDFPAHLRSDTLLQLWIGLAQFSMGFSFLAILFVKEEAATDLMGAVLAITAVFAVGPLAVLGVISCFRRPSIAQRSKLGRIRLSRFLKVVPVLAGTILVLSAATYYWGILQVVPGGRVTDPERLLDQLQLISIAYSGYLLGFSLYSFSTGHAAFIYYSKGKLAGAASFGSLLWLPAAFIFTPGTTPASTILIMGVVLIGAAVALPLTGTMMLQNLIRDHYVPETVHGYRAVDKQGELWEDLPDTDPYGTPDYQVDSNLKVGDLGGLSAPAAPKAMDQRALAAAATSAVAAAAPGGRSGTECAICLSPLTTKDGRPWCDLCNEAR